MPVIQKSNTKIVIQNSNTKKDCYKRKTPDRWSVGPGNLLVYTHSDVTVFLLQNYKLIQELKV